MLLLLCSPINKEQPQKLTSFLLKYFSAPSLSDNTNFRLRNCPLSRPLFHRNPSRYPAAESNCWEPGIKHIAEKRDRIKNRRRTLTSKPSRSNVWLDRTRQKKQVFPSDLPFSLWCSFPTSCTSEIPTLWYSDVPGKGGFAPCFTCCGMGKDLSPCSQGTTPPQLLVPPLPAYRNSTSGARGRQARRGLLHW